MPNIWYRNALHFAETAASGQGGMRMMEGETFEDAQEKRKRVHQLLSRYA